MNKSVLWIVLGVSVVVAAVFALDRSLHHFEPRTGASPARAMQRQAVREADRRADLRARTLAPDQQCVAGTVVTLRPNYASQLLKDDRPVPCKGRLAEFPIR